MAGFDLGRFSVHAIEEAAGYAIGGATVPALDWIIRPIAYRLNAEHPILIHDPDTLALIQIRRTGTGFSGIAEAAQSGLDQTRYQDLVRAQQTPPGNSELLELFRRRVLSPERTRVALQRNGIDPDWLDEYLELLHFPLSPENLAMARQQGFISDVEARRRSELQGVDNADADLLFEISGLPPGAEQMVELWRRGEVSPDRVRQSLVEGHTKLKYVEDVMKLRYQPLSASIAAEALVRQRIPQEQAVDIADKNGIRRDDFLLWSDMLGRPIATGQALQLARRDQFTFEQFKEAVARSDVRTEYADDLWKLRRVLPSLFQLRALITNGAVTDEEAIHFALDLGYDASLAHGIVQAAKTVKKKHVKDLAASQIESLYDSGLESREWAMKALQGLGYDADEAEWYLELLDARRLLSALQSNLTRIHAEFVSHKITEHNASNALDQMGVRAEVRNHLLETWTNERSATVLRLSNAQIGSALKHTDMTAEEAIRRWMENGYPREDAEWLAAIALKAPHTSFSPTAT